MAWPTEVLSDWRFALSLAFPLSRSESRSSTMSGLDVFIDVRKFGAEVRFFFFVRVLLTQGRGYDSVQ